MTQGVKFSGAARINRQAAYRAFSVHRSELRPFRRDFVFRKNCFHRAFWYTRVTIDAGFGVDYEHVVIDMECIDGADHCTIRVTTINARLSDHIGHKRIIPPRVTQLLRSIELERGHPSRATDPRAILFRAFGFSPPGEHRRAIFEVVELQIHFGEHLCQQNYLTGVHREVFDYMHDGRQRVHLKSLDRELI
jgi:hypothetical protein